MCAKNCVTQNCCGKKSQKALDDYVTCFDVCNPHVSLSIAVDRKVYHLKTVDGREICNGGAVEFFNNFALHKHGPSLIEPEMPPRACGAQYDPTTIAFTHNTYTWGRTETVRNLIPSLLRLLAMNALETHRLHLDCFFWQQVNEGHAYQ